MAIPDSQFFDYEVTLTREPDGSLAGTAASLQAARGQLPGLAGARPRVRVAGETIRVDSDVAEKPAPRWTAVFVVWFTPLNNRWIDRGNRSAQVRAFELTVPGIGDCLRPGARLRLSHHVIVNLGISSERLTDVVMTDGSGVIASWKPEAPVSVPW